MSQKIEQRHRRRLPRVVPDGRRVRGEARRQQLLDAALVVLGRDGPVGLTHRAVAEEAGVALASVSYHYDGIDDLLEKAMDRVNEDLRASIGARSDDPGPRPLAEYLAEFLNANRQLVLAEYEVYLHVVRYGRPSAAAAMGWLGLLCGVYAPELGADQRRALSATLEGASIHWLLSGEAIDPVALERTLRLAWPTGRKDSASMMSDQETDR